MANRFWVGGAATWDATAGLKWALLSGGVGGQTVPSASDDVFLDAASGANIVTVSGTRTAKSLTTTGFTGTLAGTATPIIQVSGSVVLGSGMVSPIATALQILATGSLTTNGIVITTLTINGSGITVTQQSDLSCTTLTLSQGTYDANDLNLSMSSGFSTGASTSVLNMGNGTWTFTGLGSLFNNTNASLTINCEGSTLDFTNVADNAVHTILAGTGQTLNNVRLAAANRATVTFTSVFSIQGTLTISGGAKTIILGAGTTLTVGTLALTSTKQAMVTFRSNVSGAQRTLSIAAGAIDLSNCAISDINATGGATFTSVDGADVSDNVGITFVNSLISRPDLHNINMGIAA